MTYDLAEALIDAVLAGHAIDEVCSYCGRGPWSPQQTMWDPACSACAGTGTEFRGPATQGPFFSAANNLLFLRRKRELQAHKKIGRAA